MSYIVQVTGQKAHAVATLEEAQDHLQPIARAPADRIQRSLLVAEVSRLSESGGTITLPDGTVIEVKPTTWLALAREAEHPWVHRAEHFSIVPNEAEKREILAAWNAQEAKR